MSLIEKNEESKKVLAEYLQKTGDSNAEKAAAAQQIFAEAVTTPMRAGITSGNTISEVYNKIDLTPGQPSNFPIDFYRPDNASEYKAFVMPGHGRIPGKLLEGDYVNVPTYRLANSIEYILDYPREARWDVIARILEVLEAGFVKKISDDGWHTILSAGYNRNIVVSDANAAAGQFTRRLVSLAKLTMRRNGGGNSASIKRSRLTHLYVSPEALEDMIIFCIGFSSGNIFMKFIYILYF